MAESGAKVLVLEERLHIGGNCHDSRNRFGITIHTYGPHIFHTEDDEVWELLGRFTLFRPYVHRVLSRVNGRLLPFPINIDTLSAIFGPISGPCGVKELLRREVRDSTFESPARNFRDAVVSRVGETLYGLFFANYTRKQWGRDPETILPEVARRIPVREDSESRYFTDRHQGIPAEGYTVLMREMLRHPGIVVRLGTDWFAERERLDAGVTIFTGELDRLLDRRFGPLPYRSLRFLWRTFPRERFQPAAVVNYPNERRFTRITEYKYFLEERSPWTTVSYEYPAEQGPPFFILLTEETVKLRERYREACAQLSPPLILAGRLAEYRYYDMDRAVRSAMDKVRAYLGGGAAS
jgi:UDP-galactopyranose mutase